MVVLPLRYLHFDTTSSELAGLISCILIPPCSPSSASLLPRPPTLNLASMRAYIGLLPSSPTQPSSTWYADSPFITLNCNTPTNTRSVGRNPDRFHRGCRSGVEPSGARNRRGPGVRDRGNAWQARDRQPRALQAEPSRARAPHRRGRVRALYPLLHRCACAGSRAGRGGQLYALARVRHWLQ